MRASPSFSSFQSQLEYYACGSDDGIVYVFEAGKLVNTQASQPLLTTGKRAPIRTSIVHQYRTSKKGAEFHTFYYLAAYFEYVQFKFNPGVLHHYVNFECKQDFAEPGFMDWAIAGTAVGDNWFTYETHRPSGICPVWSRPGDPSPFNTFVELQAGDGGISSEVLFAPLTHWRALTAPTSVGVWVVLPARSKTSGTAAVLVFSPDLQGVSINFVPVPLSSSMSYNSSAVLYGGDERGTLWAFTHCTGAGAPAGAVYSTRDGPGGHGHVLSGGSGAARGAAPTLAILLAAAATVVLQAARGTGADVP